MGKGRFFFGTMSLFLFGQLKILFVANVFVPGRFGKVTARALWILDPITSQDWHSLSTCFSCGRHFLLLVKTDFLPICPIQPHVIPSPFSYL